MSDGRAGFDHAGTESADCIQPNVFSYSVLMSHENVELVFSDAERLPEPFRKSKKGSIYLTPYRVCDSRKRVQIIMFYIYFIVEE